MGSFTRVVLAGLFWLATLPGAKAETGSPVEVATTEIPGFIEAGDDGLTGAYVELLEAASERSGSAHEIRLMPWVRAVRRVDRQAGVFILPFSRTEEREDRYQWAVRLREIRNGFVTLADPIDSLEGARSLDRVLVWRGTSHEDFLEEAGFRLGAEIAIRLDRVPGAAKRLLKHHDSIAFRGPAQRLLRHQGDYRHGELRRFARDRSNETRASQNFWIAGRICLRLSALSAACTACRRAWPRPASIGGGEICYRGVTQSAGDLPKATRI